MATINDQKFEPREFSVVLVDGDRHEVIGYAMNEFFLINPEPVQVVAPATEKVFKTSMRLIIDPETLEALKKLAEPKPSALDLAKLAADFSKMQSAIKAAERFGPADRIPVPKQYQRNRHKR